MSKLSQVFILLFVALMACETGKTTEDSNEITTSDTTESLIALPPDSILSKKEVNTPKDSIIKPVVKADSVASIDTTSSDYFALVPNQLSSLGVNQPDIPTVKDIGVNPYPKSVMIKLGISFDYKGKTYNTLELVNAASPEEVVEYYQKGREKWFHAERAGVHTFKKEEHKYFRETNNLQIQPFSYTKHPGVDTLLDFEPKTYIFIYYEIKNNP